MTQRAVKIDEAAVVSDLTLLRSLLKVPDFQVDVWFCSEDKIRELNRDYRNISRTTDILSFPLNEFTSPEVFQETEILPHEKHLGELVVSPAHVLEIAAADQRQWEESQPGAAGKKLRAMAKTEEVDRGVSRLMSEVFTWEQRLPLLLLHGLLHLLGHDHETEQDWRLMTAREEEIWKKFVKQSAKRKTLNAVAATTPAAPESSPKTAAKSGKVKAVKSAKTSAVEEVKETDAKEKSKTTKTPKTPNEKTPKMLTEGSTVSAAVKDEKKVKAVKAKAATVKDDTSGPVEKSSKTPKKKVDETPSETKSTSSSSSSVSSSSSRSKPATAVKVATITTEPPVTKAAKDKDAPKSEEKATTAKKSPAKKPAAVSDEVKTETKKEAKKETKKETKKGAKGSQ